MFRVVRLLPLLCLPLACTSGSDDYPRLLPTEQILAEPTLPDHAGPAADSADPVRRAVEDDGADLRRRADAIADPVDAPDLAARAADLRRRAEALRSQTAADDCSASGSAATCP